MDREVHCFQRLNLFFRSACTDHEAHIAQSYGWAAKEGESFFRAKNTTRTHVNVAVLYAHAAGRSGHLVQEATHVILFIISRPSNR